MFEYSSAKWQIFSGDYLNNIEKQVSKGIPVILQLGLGDDIMNMGYTNISVVK